MNIEHLCYSDSKGGAARAAYRLHQALIQSDLTSTMFVRHSQSGDWSVRSQTNKSAKFLNKIRPDLGWPFRAVGRAKGIEPQSPAIVPSRLAGRYRLDETDIVHLHWVNAEMMSIRDIGRIRKPIIWTLHDMWPFSGMQHYPEDDRWQRGFSRENSNERWHGFDMDRWAWKRKLKHWQKPMHLVAPSQWMANCARQSNLMAEWPISCIANAIDVEQWRPVNRKLAREIL